jgi:hypothetical protein
MADTELKDAHGAGSPRQSTVVAREALTPGRVAGPERAAAPQAARPTYQILITNQTDPYDQPLAAEAEAAAAPAGDDYAGKDRKAAKLSIPEAATEAFADLSDLIKSLVPDDDMINHDPAIGKDAASGRTTEEDRNVRVRAFLYAASREADNDFHLIVGHDPNAAPTYMTMEISGLPPNSDPSFEKINAARDAYKTFFGAQLPGSGYHFYRPPIPIEVEGSLFFDITHANGGHPGPADLRPDIPTIWEVHPVTSIVFEP